MSARCGACAPVTVEWALLLTSRPFPCAAPLAVDGAQDLPEDVQQMLKLTLMQMVTDITSHTRFQGNVANEIALLILNQHVMLPCLRN